MGVVSNLYNTLGIGYFRIVSFCVEKKVDLYKTGPGAMKLRWAYF